MYVLYLRAIDISRDRLHKDKPGNRLFLGEMEGGWFPNFNDAIFFSRDEAIEKKKELDPFCRKSLKNVGAHGGWGQAVKMRKVTEEEAKARLDLMEKKIDDLEKRLYSLIRSTRFAIQEAERDHK